MYLNEKERQRCYQPPTAYFVNGIMFLRIMGIILMLIAAAAVSTPPTQEVEEPITKQEIISHGRTRNQ